MSALADEGVGAIAVPLHGARAETHDWVAGAEGSFRASLDTIRAARSHGLGIAVRTRLTRSNARVLAELPSLLKARGASVWVIEVARAEGEAFTSIVPRFGLSIPSALAAMDRAHELGIDARLRGAPVCTLGRFADRVVPSEPRSHGTICEGCPAREGCPGVDAAYLERFGEGELRRVDPTPPAKAGPLFDMFRK